MCWRRIDDYYNIRQVLNGITEAPNHCGLCYQVECEHKLERVSYTDVNIELATWGEVALQEYPGSYLEVGEVAVYPAWPIGQEFQERFHYQPYRVFPKIKGGIFGGIVAHEQVAGYNIDLTPNDYLTKIGRKVARFGAGMYWGYGWQDEFYVIRLFRQRWQEIRRKSLPYKDVTGLTVPNFEDLPFEIDGYHFIPHSSSNSDFQMKYFEI